MVEREEEGNLDSLEGGRPCPGPGDWRSSLEAALRGPPWGVTGAPWTGSSSGRGCRSCGQGLGVKTWVWSRPFKIIFLLISVSTKPCVF